MIFNKILFLNKKINIYLKYLEIIMKVSEIRGIIREQIKIYLTEEKKKIETLAKPAEDPSKEEKEEQSYKEMTDSDIIEPKDVKADLDDKKEEKEPKEDNNKQQYYQVEYQIADSILRNTGHFYDFDLAVNRAKKLAIIKKDDPTVIYIGITGTGDDFAIIYCDQEYINDYITENDFEKKEDYTKFKNACEKFVKSDKKEPIIDKF
jgi:hypothetical protein